MGSSAFAFFTPASAAAAPTRVWARIAVSPLREEGQEPVFAAVAKATEATRAEFSGLRVAYTGVNRFAAASKARIQRELSWLNSLSLAAVLAVALVCIRNVHRALHLVPPVLFAVLGAWIGVTAAFSRVHILVFVVGALLTGVAIDYGFYLYMQPPAAPGEDYWDKVRRLAKPLFSSCFTTVAGFGLLLFSDLPLIRQLGVFVGAGLVCALAAAIVYFSMLRNSYLEARPLASSRAFPAGGRRTIRRLLLAVWLLALPGLFLLKWKDDIRDLGVPLDMRELVSYSGEWTRSVCEVCGCRGCLPDGAIREDGRLDPAFEGVAPGGWKSFPEVGERKTLYRREEA